MYDRGLGVAKDLSEAFKWFRRAAEQGYGMAQANIGTMYALGDGTRRDFVEAYKWFSTAAAGGGYLGDTKSNEDVKMRAAKGRDEIAGRLILSELADAQKRVREWKPKPEPEAVSSALAIAKGASPPSASSSAVLTTNPRSSQTAASSELPDKVYGVGTGVTPCAAYNAMLQIAKTGDEMYFAWAQGFMTALNARAPAGINVRLAPRGFPTDRQQAFLRDFCAKNPNKKYMDGILELYLKLRDIPD
jgi:hypothetical protein